MDEANPMQYIPLGNQILQVTKAFKLDNFKPLSLYELANV